jgi:NADH dehydrogenase [ubiquinone] 1 alpha subcomplex assembly factor 7
MSYDPDLRRDTQLALKLKERIKREGPITVAQYVEACLYDPTHGYYKIRDAIGTKGDFVTAPEISQIFGELIGLWCAVVWQQMGEPTAFNLVEFGPGRGTLMHDVLRALRSQAKVTAATRVILIDSSVFHRNQQRDLLAQETVPITWVRTLSEAPDSDLPAIIIGNEFLDTKPIEQFVKRHDGWVEHSVDLDARGELMFATGIACDDKQSAMLDKLFPAAHHDDIGEVYSPEPDFVHALSHPRTMTALLIDYGHLRSDIGNTLQAIRRHTYEHPLTSPGEADLTAQLDFAELTTVFARNQEVDGPVTQAEFLGSLGILRRASKLMAANPTKANEIEMGVARLMAPNGMGTRFKVIGLRSPDLPLLPGFPTL